MPTPSASELIGADADAVARFADDLAALIDLSADRLLVAVSGGPDSIALLLLAHAALGDRLSAATVDHGLRPESAAEARAVAAICAARGIPHAILTGPMPARVGRTANLSARARVLRYALLHEHRARIGADWLATAHHADDQRETMLMRLNRGAGVGGLAGIRRRDRRVVRPLLGWRRATLAAVVAHSGIVAIDDPSNRDDRFDRARLRKALTEADWFDHDGFVASAAALADADEALDWSARSLLAARVTESGDSIALDPTGLPDELLRRLVLVCLRRIDPDAAPDGPALSRAITALKAGQTATIGTVMIRPGPRWTFASAPPRRPAHRHD